MKLNSVFDEAFRPYGRVLTDAKVGTLLAELKRTPCPQDDTIYVPSDALMEALPEGKELTRVLFGELPMEIGYCNGFNEKLNALEYHRSSELNVAEIDLILLLGRQQDVTADYHYDTAKVEAFLVPAGTAIEVYATTLHYAPCCADGKPFRCLVGLPKGTNEALTTSHGGEGEDKLLTAINKWLIGHEEAGIEGAWNGLVGKNLTVQDITQL